MSGVDAAAFEAEMRARFLSKENLTKLFNLVLPHLPADGPALVYILTQCERIGHFTIEPQILKSLYGARYGRIVVITPPLTRPGTNAAVCACFGDPFVWVQTDDETIQAMGFIDGGLADLQRVHLLLQSPRLLIVDFWRKVIAGTRPAILKLPDHIRARGHEQLRSIGIDPESPFAFFHMRTMKYQTGLDHHGHRTASIERYRASIEAIIAAGYQVVRIGEPGLEPEDWMREGYVSLPDALPGLAPDDRAVDLAVLADAAFGTAQNSGPIWVAAAFGTPTLRTSTPYEHLNLPYNRDLSLFKRYRADGRFLRYSEILERRLPAVFRDSDFAERGVDLVENTADEITSATDEFLAMLGGAPSRLSTDDHRRFLDLGRDYEESIKRDDWFRSENLDFYGYAHPFGDISGALLSADPDYLA
jgi:putative glycosyltransferase (TIGR04372 family)